VATNATSRIASAQYDFIGTPRISPACLADLSLDAGPIERTIENLER
jgi:hypothetical protein